MLLLLVVVLPLIVGSHTLYLRDVLNSHLPMKVSHAEAFGEGTIPLVDPYRAGGQAALGNPNGVLLYPDNLLYRIADPLWALNAHFWLHLLLAPLAFYVLGRAWGLQSRASWVSAAGFTLSGYFFSQLNFYNLVAGVTLTPLLVGLCLFGTDMGLTSRARCRVSGGVAVTWALLLLSGDPAIAVEALGLSGVAVLVARGPRVLVGTGEGRRSLVLPTLGGLFGTLLAAPQWVEFLRILDLSFRGHWGFSRRWALLGSWDPRTLFEWFIPLAFGRPELTYWGQALHDNALPLFFSLYPGLLVLVLMLFSGAPVRPRHGRIRDEADAPTTEASLARLRWFAWISVAGGIFLVLGRHNPIVSALADLPGAQLLRFPIKFWLPVAVGMALLAGIGYQRTIASGRVLRLLAALLATASVFAVFLLCLRAFPQFFTGVMNDLAPSGLSGGLLEHELARWAGLSSFSALGLVLLGLSVWLSGRRPGLGTALLLTVHAGFQLFFLGSLVAQDLAAVYRQPPPILRLVGEHELVVQSGSGPQLFGAAGEKPGFPDSSLMWVERRGHFELYPYSGVQFGRAYELNISPEGLDSFFTLSVMQAMPLLGDVDRLRVLEALGVDVVILDRRLEGAARRRVRLRGRLESFGAGVYVYEIDGGPAIRLAGEVDRAPHLNAALMSMLDPEFNPATRTAVPGEGAALRGSPGSVEVIGVGRESLRVRTESRDPGVLVWRRTWLPIYRATVDGEPVSTSVADLCRLAVELPAGEHRVEIWVDRRPTRLAWSLFLFGLVGTFVLVTRRRESEPTM